MTNHLRWLLLLAVTAALVIGGPLLSTTTVLSSPSADVASQFLFSRAFGFGEIAQGHIPFWNPYIYGGVPFLGDFQSALLYPPNLIFLVLPLATAINWSFGLHVFLLGALTYGWAIGRGLRPAAAWVSGALAMFSGTFFLHIYAGHLSNVCAMAWVPMVFWGIDRWIAQRHLGWICLSAAAAALQIYAGHPQYVYFTAIIGGAYALIHLPGTSRWPQAAVGLLAIYPLAALLAAAQFLPGLAAAQESVRSGGVNYEFAAMFSFPPENFLTLLAPWIFGGHGEIPYWGRCYLWEMSFYLGVGGLLLAAFGAGNSKNKVPNIRLGILVLVALILALGTHTPLHHLLYDWLPGFGSFRGSSKFLYFAGLFLALFAGLGMDRLLSGDKPTRALGLTALVLGLGLLGASFWLSRSGPDSLRHLIAAILATKESYLNPEALLLPKFLPDLLEATRQSLTLAGSLWIGFALLWLAARRWQKLAPVLGGAAILEIAIFAGSTVATFPLAQFTYQPVAEYLEAHPGDYRVLNTVNPDSSMLLRKGNVWGYDPSVLKRYAELLTVTQGGNPAQASQYLPFSTFHPILAMLRCQWAFLPGENNQITIKPFPDPFPHFFLVSDYQVIPDASDLLEALRNPTFDLKTKILLEEEPNPKPDPGTPAGSIRVLDSSTDHWTLDVETDRAAILVIPDSYSPDWHVTARPDSAQKEYSLLPANHALRAIPLSKGHHVFTMEYQPRGFRLGAIVSLLTWSLLIACVAIAPLRRHLTFHE